MWLDDVHAWLDEGRPGAALEAAIDAWCARRLPALADAIDALSDVLTRALPPIAGRTRKAKQEQWLDVVNARRAVDLGRLLAVFADPPWVHVGERIERLAQVDDPRVSKAFGDFVGALPTLGGIRGSQWTLLLTALERRGDARARRPIEARLAEDDPRAVMVDQVRPGLERVRASLPTDDASADELARIVALSKRIAALAREPLPAADALLRDTVRPRKAASEAELLQLIYASPEDDAPRLVYADWLLEQGDPRAELLSLQLKAKPTGKDERRARQLLRVHGRAWLGPLEPAVELRSEVFSRGFVSEAMLSLRTAQQREQLIGHPAWNTLTRLHGGDLDFLLKTELRGLEQLWVSEESLGPLARRGMPWRRVRELHLTTRDLGLLGELHATRFPALTALLLGTWNLTDAELSRHAPDFSAPHLARIETVGLNGARGPGLLGLFGAFPALTRLVVASTMLHTFTRTPGGPWTLDVRPYLQQRRLESREWDSVRGFLSVVRRVVEPGVEWGPQLVNVRGELESLRRRFDFEWVPRPA